MTADRKRSLRWQRTSLSLPIRGKIIFPYLLLTILVAVVGTYVVTNLVASSLDERLTNHLLEAGRVVSDALAQREIEHLRAAQLVAYTRGVAEALEEGDSTRVASLASPVAAGVGVEFLLVTDTKGRQMLHLLQQYDGSYRASQTFLQPPPMVQALLETGDPAVLPRRGIARHPTNGRQLPDTHSDPVADTGADLYSDVYPETHAPAPNVDPISDRHTDGFPNDPSALFTNLHTHAHPDPHTVAHPLPHLDTIADGYPDPYAVADTHLLHPTRGSGERGSQFGMGRCPVIRLSDLPGERWAIHCGHRDPRNRVSG